jgi:hypothetical protein
MFSGPEFYLERTNISMRWKGASRYRQPARAEAHETARKRLHAASAVTLLAK